MVSCTTRTVSTYRSNILKHGTINAPKKLLGWLKEITEKMWLAIWHGLEDRPGLSQQVTISFISKQYSVCVFRVPISRDSMAYNRF